MEGIDGWIVINGTKEGRIEGALVEYVGIPDDITGEVDGL